MLFIWIGKYQSDIAYTKQFFSGSITYYGNGQENNIYCAKDTRVYNKKKFITFIIENIKKTLGSYYYVFYNQSYALDVMGIFSECKKYIMNINSKELINWLSNKTLCRLWVKNIVKVPSFCAVTGSECTYSNLKLLFPHDNKFVIQDNYSSGGVGSFIISCDSDVNKNTFDKSDIYLVSPFIENSFSVNLHMLICKNEQFIFPLSIQIIDCNNSPFIFRGSDFIAAQKIPQNIVKEIIVCAKKIGLKLADMDFRGICGVDFLIQSSNIYFIEINPRFQGSSFLINRTLLENNLPSLYELNEKSFKNISLHYLKEIIENLDVKYSYFKIKYDNPVSPQMINYYLSCTDIDTYFMDGFENSKLQNEGYLFRFISKRNLVSINPNHQINIYQNLLHNTSENLSIVQNKNWTALKVSLLTQGIKLDNSAIYAMQNLGGIQEGTFESIDLYFPNKFIVNCPLKIPFIEFSPYTLKYINSRFELFCYDTNITTVTLDKKDDISVKTTHSGILYSKLIQRNNNRIRIRHNSVCIFKQQKKGCWFCHAKNENYYSVDLKDIEESFLFYLKNVSFDKIMIGGASNDRASESELIKGTIKCIRKYTDKSIYIMSIPPLNYDDIIEYKRLGANEIAFNIEVFDDQIAKELMPGKGIISRQEYLLALKKAVDVFGTKGHVRSMLIVGLEPLKSFKNGIEKLCQIGVSPMISPFRPMPQTKLENFVPPSIYECQRYIESALIIAHNYNISLGPFDLHSQNNTFNVIEN